MKRMLGLLCGMTLLCVPMFAAAQEDGGVEDVTVMTDAAVATDAATGTDSATETDAGTTTGCGTVTYFGECTATGVTYCTDDEDGPVSYDCPAEAPCGLMDCEVGGECLDITVQGDCEGNANCGWAATDGYCYPRCYGYECLTPAGGECNVFFDLDGDGYIDFIPCENSAGYGCMDGTCATSTTCVAEDPALCNGNMIQYCRYGTYSGFDCSFGGAEPYECGNDSMGEATCLGQNGAQCSVSEGLECVTGLTCTGGICTDPTATPDAGTTTRDSGTTGGTDSGSSGGDDDDDDAACLCTAGQASSGAALLVAMMLGMALVRRRR
jgi:MYXO-CTERM domain-containing protein